MWIDWTEREPDIADELWPAVLVALRNADHQRFAELMYAARFSENVDQFRRLRVELQEESHAVSRGF